MQISRIIAIFLSLLCVAGCAEERVSASKGEQNKPKRAMMKIQKSDTEWKQLLTPEQYRVLREKGTERAYTGEYWDNHERGLYICAGCGAELFSSDAKFESGTGWPSFTAPLRPEAVAVEQDNSLFMRRTEVLCASCGGHLGHLFDDGPAPTGMRYCMNSVSLKFEKK